MGRNRNDRGRFTESTHPEEILRVFENHEPRTTQEVADSAGIPKRTAYEKLKELTDCGEIKRKDIGKLATVWYKDTLEE